MVVTLDLLAHSSSMAAEAMRSSQALLRSLAAELEVVEARWAAAALALPRRQDEPPRRPG